MRFVIDQHVLGRDTAADRVVLHVVLHATHKGLAAIRVTLEFVLKHLDQGSVAREEYGRRRRLAARTWSGEIVDEVRVHQAQTNERLAGSRNASEQYKATRARFRGLVNDRRHRVDCRLCRGGGTLDPTK